MKRKHYYEIAAEHSANLTLITVGPLADKILLARALPEVGIIMIRYRPDTLLRLWRFLHECAHCQLHRDIPPRTPYHSLELDAERYVVGALQNASVKLSARLLSKSRDYIFGELGADLRAGFDPTPGVFEYLQFTEEEAQDYVNYFRGLPQTNQFLRNSPGSWGSRQWAEQAKEEQI